MVYDNMIPVTMYADGNETLHGLYLRTPGGRPFTVVGIEVENLSTGRVIRFKPPYKNVTPYIPDEMEGKIGEAIISGETFYPAEFEIPTPCGCDAILYLLLKQRSKEKPSPFTVSFGATFPSDPRC
jgi:hypothetical protein